MENIFEFRASSLRGRAEFYEEEFSLEKIKSWFRENKIKIPQICTLDAGNKSKIFLNKKFKNKLFYFKFSDIIEKINKYLPEGIYYDRNKYTSPDEVLDRLDFKNRVSQELAFDIDADNIADINLSDGKNYRKALEESYKQAMKMKKELEEEFEKVLIIYSGRGFHIHVIDKRTYFLTNAERDLLVKKFSKYSIDSWVSRGNIRLIRMPYRLNRIVSRIVIPMKTKTFNEKKAIPQFLKKNF